MDTNPNEQQKQGMTSAPNTNDSEKPTKSFPWGIVVLVVILAGVGVLFATSGEKRGASEDIDISGIHIMQDGSVMLGSGKKIEDAEVTEDSMIRLPDGRVVEPAMDLREGGSMEQ